MWFQIRFCFAAVDYETAPTAAAAAPGGCIFVQAGAKGPRL